MEASTDPNQELLSRLETLGRRDREAILDRLSDEERRVIDAALTERAQARAAELERQRRIDRQFLGYSPALAARLEACENGYPNAMSKVAAEAAWRVHSAAVASREAPVRTGWLGVWDRLSDALALVGKSAS